MPLAQVIELNGQKQLVPVPGGISGAGSGIDTEARALAQEAISTAQGCLPLAGGTMIGPVSNLTLAGTPGVYDASAVNSKWVSDYALKKAVITEFAHIGGDNASDTADLNAGRGSEDKPFATLKAALLWANSHYNGTASVVFRVHTPQTLTSFIDSVGNLGRASISSANEDAIVTISGFNAIIGGTLALQEARVHFTEGSSLVVSGEWSYANLIITGGCVIDGDGIFFSARNGARMYVYQDLTINGTAHANGVFSVQSGSLCCFDPSANLTGTVTGKKYSVVTGGMLVTNGRSIPGDVAGTCDANSKVI